MTFQAQKAEKHVTVDAVRAVLDLLDVAIFAQHNDFHIVLVVKNISRLIVHLQIRRQRRPLAAYLFPTTRGVGRVLLLSQAGGTGYLITDDRMNTL